MASDEDTASSRPTYLSTMSLTHASWAATARGHTYLSSMLTGRKCQAARYACSRQSRRIAVAVSMAESIAVAAVVGAGRCFYR